MVVRFSYIHVNMIYLARVQHEPLHTSRRSPFPASRQIDPSLERRCERSKSTCELCTCPFLRSICPCSLISPPHLSSFSSRLCRFRGEMWREYREFSTSQSAALSFQHITMDDPCAWPPPVQPGRCLEALHIDAGAGGAGNSRSGRDIEWKVFLQREWRRRQIHHAVSSARDLSFIPPLPMGSLPSMYFGRANDVCSATGDGCETAV